MTPARWLGRCSPGDVRRIRQPSKSGRKGDNGRILVIGGSREYFGAPIHSLRAASLFVDLAFYSPFPDNNALARKVKLANQDVIVCAPKNLTATARRCDAILLGPGMAESVASKRIVDACLSLGKPTVLDAGAMLVANRKLWRADRVALTPHSGEFKRLFGVEASAASARAMAAKWNCSLLVKNHGEDYVTDGRVVFVNKSGIPAMAKGGTGDVLAGLAVAFAARNELLLSLKAAAFLNGAAGRLLEKKKSWAFSATDLAEAVPAAFALLR